MRTRYWATVVVAGFAVYSVIAVAGTISAIAYWHQAHIPFDLESFLANRVLEQWTCAVFVAPLFWLVGRFPLSTGTPRARNAAILVSAIALFILAKYALMMPLYYLWTGSETTPYWLQVLDNAVPVSFDFIAIIGVAHALQYHRAVGERERVAAELRSQLTQARLDALRRQLHPHFIFNSLNAAATLVHDDAEAADRMLTQLGDLLRMSLDRDQAEITLAEEMELADRYLAIMRHRFSDRLTVRCTVEIAARNALVPTFFIQPLIENAFEHGVDQQPGPARVEIAARRENGSLQIIVADNGPGISAVASPGVGISNTHARLAQLYGAESSLRLETIPGGGARAIVRIPYRECAAS